MSIRQVSLAATLATVAAVVAAVTGTPAVQAVDRGAAAPVDEAPPAASQPPAAGPSSAAAPTTTRPTTASPNTLPAPPTPRPALAITVATWNLNGTLPQHLASPDATLKPVWRNTFGPRPSAITAAKLTKRRFDADVVALQGVRNVRTVRRLFPARRYHVIVSRHILAPHRPRVVAIAIKRASGFRVIAQQHMPAFAGNPRLDARHKSRSAAVAIRLRRRQRTVWLLSTALQAPCRGTQPNPAIDCTASTAQWKLLRTWLAERKARGEPAIVAGTFAQALHGASWRKLTAAADTATPATGDETAAGSTVKLDPAAAATNKPDPAAAAVAARKTPKTIRASGPQALTTTQRIVRWFAPTQGHAARDADRTAGPRAKAKTTARGKSRAPAHAKAFIANRWVRFPAHRVPSACGHEARGRAPIDFVVADLRSLEASNISARGDALIVRETTPQTGDGKPANGARAATHQKPPAQSQAVHCPVLLSLESR
ncbi:MAG: hypothetical protein AAFR04_10855 [Pseudomonadota bacterium]